MNDNTITKGSVVRYKNSWMEVTAAFKRHVNLGHIFHGKTTIKKVPLSEVYEDHDAWHKEWEQSDTYKCM
jgi:hypothetical protein